MNLPQFYVDFIEGLTPTKLKYFTLYCGTYLCRYMDFEGLTNFINNFNEEKWGKRKKNQNTDQTI